MLWSREHPPGDDTPFDWKQASWHLKVPMIDALFAQIAQPGPIEELGLRAILDRTAEVLNRVDRAAFFQRFQAAAAVQYFYEPFLEAFDPALRKELGVWYTPREVVQYMVARVDAVLRSELGIARGLADPSVYVLDPCCGTGAYLVEVLERIAGTLREEGGDALVASDLRKAARERVFGFELLPAPFVVSHLQLGLLLQRLGAPLGGGKGDRAGVFLTNALTGWGADEVEQPIPFPGMEEERDRSDEVKRSKPILVILGNPPYNGFAGVGVKEERDLSSAYRATVRAPKPQGQGLNDLYVRFFRMAERKIVEGTGRGIISFISNYSWLDGLSFTGMRERYLERFDGIWVDCLNGDKYKTGKLTPEGEPDPSIFSTESNREGIQVGTAITLLVRKQKSKPAGKLLFRHLWGKEKRAQLVTEAEGAKRPNWEEVGPAIALGLPFAPILSSNFYLNWPLLPEVIPVSYPGIQPSRDELLVDIDRSTLVDRIRAYFDPRVSDEQLSILCPTAMRDTSRYDASAVREYLLDRGMRESGFVKYCYRPLDVRWLYWEQETKLLDEKREDYFPLVRAGTYWLATAQRNRRDFDPPIISQRHCSRHILERGANLFPSRIARTSQAEKEFFTEAGTDITPNLSSRATNYLRSLRAGGSPDELFFHTVSILHTDGFSEANSGALRQDWPRIPLPAKREDLEASAAMGRQLADLLDPEIPVEGVSTGKLRADLRPLGVLSTTDKRPIDPEHGDLALTAGWGSGGKNGVTMPGKGKVIERPDGAQDIYLNDRVYWANLPAAVWEYTLGGYQVIKKWLSYREKRLLGRDLKDDEARYVSEMVRRIAAILALGPALDASYERVKADTYPWPRDTA